MQEKLKHNDKTMGFVYVRSHFRFHDLMFYAHGSFVSYAYTGIIHIDITRKFIMIYTIYEFRPFVVINS